MMPKPAWFALLITLAALAGCATPDLRDPMSPYFEYPAGTQITLNRAIEIPAGWATVRLQAGQPVAFGHVQEHEPHCIFEIDTVRPTAQQVEPDSFVVTRVQRSMSESSVVPNLLINLGAGDDDGYTQLFYKTIFTLKSEKQPGVRELTCQSDQYAPGVGIPKYLTLGEIRSALGTWFSLDIPGETRPAAKPAQ